MGFRNAGRGQCSVEPHDVNVRRHTFHGLLYGPVQPAGQRQSEDFHAILVPLFVFRFVYLDTASVLTIQFQYSEHGIKQLDRLRSSVKLSCNQLFLDVFKVVDHTLPGLVSTAD